MRLAVLMSVATPWAREVVVRLSEFGHEIHVIAFRQDRDGGYLRISDDFQSSGVQRLKDSAVTVHFIDSNLRSQLRYLLSAPTLRRILGRCEADVLLTLYGGGFAAMAFASGFRPYAVYAVGSDVLESRGMWRLMTRIALRSAKRIFVNGIYLTEKTRELVPSVYPILLYLGVDTKRFSPSPRSARPVRILCTRGFWPVYNNEYLIRALAMMPETVVNYTVTFVSSGPLLASSRQLADELLPCHVRSRVEFLGGVSDKRLTEIVRISHIYVSTSRSDGTSSSLLEALASGLFPVLSDIPQNREWINVSKGLRNGILVPLDEPDTLGRALREAILDEKWRNEVVNYNRSLVLTRASSRTTMKDLVVTLESIVRKPKATPHELYGTDPN